VTFRERFSRREMLAKLAILFNGIIAVLLAIPIVRYVLSSVFPNQKVQWQSWLSLGKVNQFPAGQTRLATFRNPHVQPWDGKTAESVCWVRCIESDKFQVFAINCAHLGCPVRWFPQSELFMCPCHGGVYYQDGSRAAGPPLRGLFEYPYKVENGELYIEAGQLPTPGDPYAGSDSRGEFQCS
jgi:Rieske Fe-S protein